MPSSTRAVPSWLTREHSAISPAPASTAGPDAGCTVTADVPTMPSLVALIVAVPAASPATNPLPFTAAMEGALLAQVTVRPLSALPLASFGVAVRRIVPFARIVAALGGTATAATGRRGNPKGALPRV